MSASSACHATDLANQGAQLAAEGQYEAAAALFQRSLQVQPSDAAVHDMLAQCLLETGEDEAAYGAATAAASLRPSWPAALLTLGRAARNTGRLKEAAAAYLLCLECSAITGTAARQPAEPGASAQQSTAKGQEGSSSRSPAQDEEQEHQDLIEAAQQELAEVQQLQQQQLGHQLGLPGLRLLEQQGSAAGPGCVVWEAGALLAYFLVQQHQRCQVAGGCTSSLRGGAPEVLHSCSGHAACGVHTGRHDACSHAAAARGSFLQGARVLELGAGGTGIVGLAAACLGATVTATDLPEVLPQLRSSVALNQGMIDAAGGSTRIAALDWRQPEDQLLCPQPPDPQYDWLVGADLVFSPAAVGPLVTTIAVAVHHAAQMHNASLKVLISHKHRHDEVDNALLVGLRAAGIPLRAVLRDTGSKCIVYGNDAACTALAH